MSLSVLQSPRPSGDDLAQRWLSSLEARGASPHTIAAYRSDLRRVCSGHTAHLSDLRTWSPATIAAALDNAYADRSPATRRRYYATLRSFAAWLVAQGVLDHDPVANVPAPRSAPFDPRPLRGTHIVAALLQAAQTPTRSRSAWPERDGLLIAMLATTAIRASEAAQAELDDIDGPAFERTLRVLGKGGRVRYIPLVDEIDGYLSAYLLSRTARLGETERHSAHARLFVRRFGGPMTRAELGNVVRRCARIAGVTDAFPDGAHLHAFRHRVATDLLRSGASVLAVQQILGHSSLRMTQRYLAITGSELRQAVDGLPERADLAPLTS